MEIRPYLKSEQDMVAKSGQWLDLSGYQGSRHSFWLANWESRVIWNDLLTDTTARYCSGKYPQVRLSNYCFASPYQQIITISVNFHDKRETKECVLESSLTDMGYHGAENKSSKTNKNGKHDFLTGYFPCCFSVSKNSTILVLWDLFHLCNYPYLARDIRDWGRAGSWRLRTD